MHDLEYALGRAIVSAAVAQWCRCDLAGELREELTALRVIRRDRVQRADGTRENQPVLMLGEGEGSSEPIERVRGIAGAIAQRAVRRRISEREAAAGGAENGGELPSGETVAQRGNERGDRRGVGCGEVDRGTRCDPEFVRGLPARGASSGGAFDEAIALEESELRAERIGGNPEAPGQLVRGGRGELELLQKSGSSVADGGSDPVGYGH